MGRSMLVAGGVIVIAACGGKDRGTNPCTDCGGPLVHASRVTATSGLAFNPSAVTIPAGDTIYYTFEGVQHNVIFDATAGAPANVPNTQSATVKRKFATAGTFAYHCSIHPSMTGSITVNP